MPGRGSNKKNDVSGGLFFSQIATDMISRLLPHLPVDEAPEVLRGMSEAFSAMQTYQNRLELAQAESEKHYQRETALQQSEVTKALKRIENLEAALSESKKALEAARRDKEEAYRQTANMHVQFTLWKSHQAENKKAMLASSSASSSLGTTVADEVRSREAFRDLLRREYEEKERVLEQQTKASMQETVERLRAQHREDLAVQRQQVEAECNARHEENLRLRVREMEARESQEVKELAALAMKLQDAVDRLQEQNQALQAENRVIRDKMVSPGMLHSTHSHYTAASAIISPRDALEAVGVAEGAAGDGAFLQTSLLEEDAEEKGQERRTSSPSSHFRGRPDDAGEAPGGGLASPPQVPLRGSVSERLFSSLKSSGGPHEPMSTNKMYFTLSTSTFGGGSDEEGGGTARHYRSITHKDEEVLAQQQHQQEPPYLSSTLDVSSAPRGPSSRPIPSHLQSYYNQLAKTSSDALMSTAAPPPPSQTVFMRTEHFIPSRQEAPSPSAFGTTYSQGDLHATSSSSSVPGGGEWVRKSSPADDRTRLTSSRRSLREQAGGGGGMMDPSRTMGGSVYAWANSTGEGGESTVRSVHGTSGDVIMGATMATTTFRETTKRTTLNELLRSLDLPQALTSTTIEQHQGEEDRRSSSGRQGW